jgi:ABC-type multidrug transport system ATPase subunit
VPPEIPMISISEIYKDFGNVIALDGFSLEVEPGIFGLIGPNGAGKTTLIRILLGLIKPDVGKAQIFGLNVAENSLGIRRRIGILHEKPAFPKNMKVLDYLRKVAMIYDSEKSANKMLELVELSYASKRKIGHLSAGMHQRLGIAQALIGNPELVLLDEPTSNLDVTGRDAIIRLIVSLHNELEISFFISSHILSELERACHNIAFVKAGRVVERGTVLEIIEKHTEGWFRIITSDSVAIFQAIEGISGLADASISGANAIIVKLDLDRLKDIQSKIVKISQSLGVKVYAIEKALSLEDAYRGIMK